MWDRFEGSDLVAWGQAIEIAILLLGVLVAWINLKKFRNARGVDFTLSAEGQIDPLHHMLLREPPDVVRRIFGSKIPDSYSDEDVRAFVFYFNVYSHVSRMYFLLSNKSIDLGLDRKERSDFVEVWVSHLAQFAQDPVMKHVHAMAKRDGDFNAAFLDAADSVLG